jgi:hypothetical protein
VRRGIDLAGADPGENALLVAGTADRASFGSIASARLRNACGNGSAVELIPSGPVSRCLIKVANGVWKRRSSATRNSTIAVLE